MRVAIFDSRLRRSGYVNGDGGGDDPALLGRGVRQPFLRRAVDRSGDRNDDRGDARRLLFDQEWEDRKTGEEFSLSGFAVLQFQRPGSDWGTGAGCLWV